MASSHGGGTGGPDCLDQFLCGWGWGQQRCREGLLPAGGLQVWCDTVLGRRVGASPFDCVCRPPGPGVSDVLPSRCLALSFPLRGGISLSSKRVGTGGGSWGGHALLEIGVTRRGVVCGAGTTGNVYFKIQMSRCVALAVAYNYALLKNQSFPQKLETPVLVHIFCHREPTNKSETPIEGASTHRAPAPRAPRAVARYQESDYCTTFSGNNATQTPQKAVTGINIKRGNDRMGVVNQMSSVMCRNHSCSYSERRYIWTPMRRPRKDRRSTRCMP